MRISFGLRVALIASASLTAVFTFVAAVSLFLGGWAGSGQGFCSREPSPAAKQRLDVWEVDRGGIEGFPPNRTCRAYAWEPGSDVPVQIDEREYPGDDWYRYAFLVALSPLVLFLALQAVKARQRPSSTT